MSLSKPSGLGIRTPHICCVRDRPLIFGVRQGKGGAVMGFDLLFFGLSMRNKLRPKRPGRRACFLPFVSNAGQACVVLPFASLRGPCDL